MAHSACVMDSMDFKQVIQTCLNFSIANGGTLQSYSASMPDMLAVHSRTTRTEILVRRAAGGGWQVELLKNAVGEKNQAKEIVSTQEHLLENLLRLWSTDTDGVDS